MDIRILTKEGIFKPQCYELLEDLEVQGVTIPKGYQTDATSIPKWLSIPLIFLIIYLTRIDHLLGAFFLGLFTICIFLFDKKDVHFIKQSIYHDYLIDEGNVNRFKADRMYFNALISNNTHVFICIVFYLSVSLVTIIKKIKGVFSL